MKSLTVLLIGLALSLSACADTSTIGASGAAGIQGTVLLGPMCPVQQAGSPCPDKPIKADVTVTASNGKTIATGHSNKDGTYRIALAPGSYAVKANRPGGAFGSGKPTMVEVPAGTYVHLNLLVDSGIR